MHLILQHINLATTITKVSIAKLVQAMLIQEQISAEQAKALDVNALYAFFDSPLGKRIQQSELVRREYHFTMAMLAQEIHLDLLPEDTQGEKVIVQGVIDCLFDEPDGLVLVDYKTDKVFGVTEEEIVARYRGQINLYTKAVETILKKPVKEKWIYLLSEQKAIQI